MNRLSVTGYGLWESKIFYLCLLLTLMLRWNFSSFRCADLDSKARCKLACVRGLVAKYAQGGEVPRLGTSKREGRRGA